MSTTTVRSPRVSTVRSVGRRSATVRRLVGGFYLVMGGINAGSLDGAPQASGTTVEPSLPGDEVGGPPHDGRDPTASGWTTLVLAVLVTTASLYGLLADAPYRSLPDATVLGARAQDACSIVVAALLVSLWFRPRTPGGRVQLVRVGLLAYLAYSYLIYVSGVPMNRMFLVYVAIIAVSGGGLLAGVWNIVARPLPSRATPRLRLGTGWMLLTTAVLFAALWLSTLLPFALGGPPPDPEGIGGTPYPVFWLDLAITLPAIASVGVVLVRGRPAGPPLAVVALVKIVTLFTALWAGPVTTALTGGEVHLGPDAGPSLLLLAGSTWLVVHWVRTMGPPAPGSVRQVPHQ